jgi:SNF2 family DNA or RNA helicase
MRPSQDFLVDEICDHPVCMIVVPMGWGKTGPTLTACRRLIDTGTVRKVLVVAPLRVAENTWPDEIDSWEHTKLLTHSVLTGSAEERARAAREDTEFHIINRENIRWLVEFWGDRWPYDMLVYDECSRLKAGKKRTPGGKKTAPRLSEFGSLARVRAKMHRVVELTGTPSPNGIIDLWGPAYIMDLGERLGSSRTAFLSRWFDSDYMGYRHTPKPHAQAEILNLLSDVMIGLRPDDHVELPEVVNNFIRVRLPDSIMREYRRFERTLVSDAYDVEACHRGVLTNKLLQFSNGSMYRPIEGSSPPKREIVQIHDAKMAALESVVEEAAGQQVLVAYSFRFDLDRIRKKYPRAVVFDEEPDFVRKWNRGEIGIGLAHPASIGHGLNLQVGGHIACWYGLIWSLELYQQFNARLPRPGQLSDHVFIHHIIAEGTADEDVLRVLNTNGATQDDIVATVRARVLQNPIDNPVINH